MICTSTGAGRPKLGICETISAGRKAKVVPGKRRVRVVRSWFPCGTPLESNAGVDLVRPQSFDEAKKLLKEAGYNGEKVVIMQPTDIPISNAFALVVGKALRD